MPSGASVSDSLARGWSRPDHDPQPAPVLCDHHAQVTAHLDDFRAGQIARQCPDCLKEAA